MYMYTGMYIEQSDLIYRADSLLYNSGLLYQKVYITGYAVKLYRRDYITNTSYDIFSSFLNDYFFLGFDLSYYQNVPKLNVENIVYGPGNFGSFSSVFLYKA